MKTAQEIAEKVDASKFNRRTPPGKAQQVILCTLGVEAESFGHANAIFEKLGIIVMAKRQGCKSVPVVQRNDLSGGDFNRYGEGEAWDLSVDVDLSAIQDYIEE